VSAPLRLWPGLDDAPGGLSVGRDLLVSCPAARTVSVPQGVLLDDWLDMPARVQVEERAREAARAWVSERRETLTVQGTDLGWIWEIELYRDAFLAVERLLAAAIAAVEGLGAERLEVAGADARTAAALVEALAPLGCAVALAGAPAELAVPEGLTSLSRAQRLMVASGLGAPQRVLGQVLVVNAPTSAPVVAALARGGGLVPVLDPASLPGLPMAELARTLWRGGWVGVPGRVRRGRSAAMVGRALAAARELAPAHEPAAELAHAHALELLARRAQATLALVDRCARALAKGRIGTVVVPFDSLASVRVLLAASRDAAVPSVLVQHGYAPEPNDPDKGEADHTAAWAERDAREVRERHGRDATVTGNPAAPSARSRRRPARGGPTLALLQSPTVFSARWDARVSQRFVAESLAALGRVRPASEVILRPHPLEPSPDAFLGLVPATSSLRARVDVHTPLAELLENCDACVGGVSTATLQAGVAGLTTAFLDVTGGPLPEPFDHAGALPSARDAAGLAEALGPALIDFAVAGQDELAEALGVVGEPGATARVLDLIERLPQGAAASS